MADPIYGLNIECPVIGLDFASLYPNIQRTLNLGPDTLIRDSDIQKYLKSNNVHNKKDNVNKSKTKQIIKIAKQAPKPKKNMKKNHKKEQILEEEEQYLDNLIE